MIFDEIEQFYSQSLALTGKPINELVVMELGNIVIKNCLGVRGKQYSKDWFKASNVVSHTSIDTNGRGGALPLDLGVRMPIYDATADFVSSCGTAEHVTNVFEAFNNMYQWGKVGSVLCVWGPPVGTAPKHSPWAFSLHLPYVLAQYSGYALAKQDMFIATKGRNINQKDNLLLCFTMQKITNQPFLTEEQWIDMKVVEPR